jgi:hypothetical protein
MLNHERITGYMSKIPSKRNIREKYVANIEQYIQNAP